MAPRILIVDDDDLLRHGVRSLLEEESLHVCGEARNGKEGVEMVAALRPDLVILDLAMPVMNGMEAACEIRRLTPSTKIVILTAHHSPMMKGAVELVGVDAFVLKSAPTRELVETIRDVLRRPGTSRAPA